ncbi:serine/threonine-protein kinase [Streptomyces sp. 4N509B]|uniref:serine/threonine-protein kinase n=1 Tax=Streptomyces sp. 4N509B TaxID=3457413 RepID=UPI003FD6B7B5
MVERGTVLGGRYALVAETGRDRAGVLWLAEDREAAGLRVVVRLPHPELLGDATYAAGLRREAGVLGALDHPNLARVHAVGEHEAAEESGEDGPSPRVVYLVTELVDGRRWDEVRRDDGGTLPAERALGLVAEALDGIAAAHERGIAHRGLTPSNLMLRADGRVAVTDVGVAPAVPRADRAAPAMTGHPGRVDLATARYLAPEQAEGRGSMPASDLYALGAVCHELLTGATPFTGSTPAEVMARLAAEPAPPLPTTFPEPVRAFLATALARRPEDRFPNAAAMAAAAREAAVGLPRRHRQPGPVARRRRMSLAMVAALAIVAITAALVVYAAAPSGEPEATAPEGVGASATAADGGGEREPDGERSELPSSTASDAEETTGLPGTPSSSATDGEQSPGDGDDEREPGGGEQSEEPGEGGGGAASGGGNGEDEPTSPPDDGEPGPPSDCGGDRWGQITSVADGLPIGLADENAEPGSALVMGGHSTYGWLRTDSYQDLDAFLVCDADGPALALDTSSRAILLPAEVGWELDDSAPSGAHYLRAFDQCLTNNGAGQQLTLGTCVPGDARQMWRLPA